MIANDEFPFWDPVRKGLVVKMPSGRLAKVTKVTLEEVMIKYQNRPKDTVTFNIDWFETEIVKKKILPEFINEEPKPNQN
jgi:hypothetical protein